MKFDQLRAKQSPRLMIIPMIDIMFFLLVFFMMSTLYMVEQKVIPVTLPQASAAQSAQTEQVTITLTAQGSILVGQEPVSPELLLRRIQAEISRNQDMAFVLRDDRQIEYGHVVWLMDELKKCGVRRVSVAADIKP